jgi:SHS2 domain-containing protein
MLGGIERFKKNIIPIMFGATVFAIGPTEVRSQELLVNIAEACLDDIDTSEGRKIYKPGREMEGEVIDRSFFDMPSGTIYKMKTDDFLGIEVELEKKDGDIILKFKDKGVVLGIIDYSSKHCKRVV